MRVLDVFSALGGWSDGFANEGFIVLGIDIEPTHQWGYKHAMIQADMNYSPLQNKKLREYFDVIIGSPPCREFSRFGNIKKWKTPQNANNGLKLVHIFLKLVEETSPCYWLMENVPRIQEYLGQAKCTVKLAVNGMKRSFYGNFPPFLIPQQHRTLIKWIKGKHRSLLRAKIPLPVSTALAQAIKEKLTEEVSK